MQIKICNLIFHIDFTVWSNNLEIFRKLPICVLNQMFLYLILSYLYHSPESWPVEYMLVYHRVPYLVFIPFFTGCNKLAVLFYSHMAALQFKDLGSILEL